MRSCIACRLLYAASHASLWYINQDGPGVHDQRNKLAAAMLRPNVFEKGAYLHVHDASHECRPVLSA